MSLSTTDLCDANPEIQVCEPLFQIFGGNVRCSGPITTVKVFENNTLIKQAVESPGNGWAGRVVHGCIRDAEELVEQPLGVRALGAFPRKSERGLHSGQTGRTVVLAGVVFREGEWLCADSDGIVVLPEAPSAG